MFTLAPWLIWITPLAGALLTPVLARIHSNIRNYAVHTVPEHTFALILAVVAATPGNS